MKSKKSLCNHTLLKQDLHRFMPAMIFHILLLQLFITLPAFTSLYACTNQAHVDLIDLANVMITAINGLSFSGFAMMTGLIYAVLLFSYLNKEKEAYNLHALPICRETMFFSHYIAGIIFMTIPVAVTMLLLFILNGVFNVGMPTIMLITFVEIMIENIFFFSLGCAVMMLSGNNITSVIVYFILNGCVPVFSIFSQDVRSLYVYGLQNNQYWNEPYVKYFTPVMYFENYIPKYLDYENVSTGPSLAELFDLRNFGHTVLYLIPAILLVIIAVILYKKRHIEEVGELMVFPFAKSVFRFVFTIYASMLLVILIENTSLSMVTDSLTYSQHFPITVVLMVICGFISYILSNMILSRSVHVFKQTSYLACSLLVLCMVVFMFSGSHKTFSFYEERVDQATVYFYDWYQEENIDYTFDPDEIHRLTDFITKIQKEGQNRPVSYRASENITGCTNIYLHYAGDSKGVNSYTLSFDLDKEQIAELKELLIQYAYPTPDYQ